MSGRITVIGGALSEDIKGLIAALPEHLGCAVLVLVPERGDLTAELRAVTKLTVVEAGEGTRPQADHVYVLPSGRDVVLRDGKLHVSAMATPGVQLDRLLRSVSDECDRDAIAVVLTGPGTDGALGVKRVKEAGGMTFAQTPPEGLAGDMPRAAIATGVVDQVGDVATLAATICRIPEDDSPLSDDPDRRQVDESASDTLRDILALVRVRSGHDFSSYKRATLYRRVSRRMQVSQTSTIAEYHQYLRDRPAELAHLLRDFLISVTNFFRDPDGFDALSAQVIPHLFDGRSTGDPVRVWVAGCATGEEAYSLGMLLLEQVAKQRDAPPIQIFATDIDEDALTEARAGRYPETIAVDVSPTRLERFFVREAGGYRVSQELRELVLFSPHNLLRDPPFSRLDLVSCRNLLIYLNKEAQSRVLSLFHFGLRPEGRLFLGSSESAESSTMFTTLDPKFRIFSRRMVPTSLGADGLVTTGRWSPPPIPPPVVPPAERGVSLGEVHHRLVELYAPPSILVNGDLEVIHLSEHAGRYLELGGGEPTRHILRLIHPALRLDLRTAIYAARQHTLRTDVRRVVIEDEDRRRTVEIRIRALDVPELGPNALLIYLDEPETDGRAEPPARETDALIAPIVQEIEDELHRTRDQLRTTIEQYETSLEELKASNEELQAINEELRSASEELETSKEELQSVNEELTTLNHELKVKIDEVSHANSDLQNLMTSTEIGVVFLDRSINIKRFTPRALDLFNMIPSDIGRPLAHLTHRLDTDELPALASHVLQHLRTIERDVTSRDGSRYLLRLLPYRSLEDRIDGVVMTFVDVTDLRAAVDARLKTEAALETSEARLRAALHAAPLVVITMDVELRTTWGYVLGAEVPPGALPALPFATPDDATLFSRSARDALATGVRRQAEITLAVEGVRQTYDIRFDRAGKDVSAVGFDITSSKQAETALRDADRRKDEFLATLSHELRNPLTPLRVALDVARAAGDNPATLAKSQAIMERQVAVLTALVDDLLDLSRITQGKIELARVPIDPVSVLDAALETTRPLIAEQDHELELVNQANGGKVLGDPTRLTQVLTNLIGNAAKYTPRGGKITISLEDHPVTAAVVFRVRDTGVGIAEMDLPRVFEMFMQSRDSLGRSRGGLGVGLNLVKRIVELHGGRVSATSDGLGKGTEFAVELPRLRS